MKDSALAIRKSVEARGKHGPNSSGEYMVCCPYCIVKAGKADLSYKMALKPSDGLYYCYRCNSGGRTNMDWFEYVVPAKSDKPTLKYDLSLPKEFELLNTESPMHALYTKYLRKRGVLDHAKNACAGVCRAGQYAGRIIIPHYDYNKRRYDDVVGFVARTINPKEKLRYLYPKGMDRKCTVWASRPLMLSSGYSRAIYIVEGIFDALSLYPQGVATFGKNVTDEQIELIVNLQASIVVCLDGDAWLEARALAARFWLRGRIDVKWCRLPPKTDPGELGWEIEKYIQPIL